MENGIADVSRKSKAIASVCCGLVVLLHAGNISVDAAQQRFSAFVETLFSREISAIAVPMFFALSGYWAGRLFTPPLKTWYRKILLRKVSTLLLPYLAWCTIYALTALPFTILGNHLAGRPAIHNTCLADTAFSLQNLFRIYGGNLLGIPADGPLWFVRNLMILFLVSPLLIGVLRNMRLGAAACAAIMGCFIFQDFLPLNYGRFFETGFSLR